MKKHMSLAALLALVPVQGMATEPGWFARAWGGYSHHSDVDLDAEAISAFNTQADVSVDGGFNAGAGVGYRYSERWAVELAWEYRSNDSETELGSGERYPDGNLASNTFYLNGFYHFPTSGTMDFYVGAGLGWLQEIDIDLEGNGPEQSYSGDGDIGVQLFLGADYALSDAWALQGEVRYARFSDIDLDGEARAEGTLAGLDYEPLTLQLGIVYRF